MITPLGCWQVRRHLEGVRPSSRYTINAEDRISTPVYMYSNKQPPITIVNVYSGPDSELGSGNREVNQTQTLTPEAHTLMGKAAVETVTKQWEDSPKRTIPGLEGPRGRSSSLCPPGHERPPPGSGGDEGQTESRDQHKERLRGEKAEGVSGAGWACCQGWSEGARGQMLQRGPRATVDA